MKNISLLLGSLMMLGAGPMHSTPDTLKIGKWVKQEGVVPNQVVGRTILATCDNTPSGYYCSVYTRLSSF